MFEYQSMIVTLPCDGVPVFVVNIADTFDEPYVFLILFVEYSQV